jgi:hypothetical protein
MAFAGCGPAGLKNESVMGYGFAEIRAYKNDFLECGLGWVVYRGMTG